MSPSRRAILQAAIGASATPGVTLARRAPIKGEFLWGVATAAHQIEGNNTNSDYWVLEHVPSTGFPEPSGDACDSWERWREDVALVAALGLNAYRFSIEWARIEPEPGIFSRAVLDHYRRMCAACREAGITPVVTFHHFTSPRWIAGSGGWENPATADRFARYCEQAARAIGDLIDWACTINEPNAQVTSWVMNAGKPFAREAAIRAEAAHAVGADRFHGFFQGNSLKVRDVALAAHIKGREAIKAVVPGVSVGMTLALQQLVAAPGGDALVARVIAEARTPFLETANRDDFVGVQVYNRNVIGPTGYLPSPADAQVDAWHRDSDPRVIGTVVREVHAACAAPIVITENGINAADDAQRTRYLPAALGAVRECRASGIPLLGYIHWSLLDNFEWGSGYGPRFGLYACDPKTFERRAKPSAAVYRRLVAQARGVAFPA